MNKNVCILFHNINDELTIISHARIGLALSLYHMHCNVASRTYDIIHQVDVMVWGTGVIWAKPTMDAF